MNPHQGQRNFLRRRAQDVDLPERPVPHQSSAEHRLDVAADVDGGLGDSRRRGEDVVCQVEAPVDKPRMTAARLTHQLLGEASVRDVGRTGGLSRCR